MGTFRVSIEVGDPLGQRYETVEALVGTGAPCPPPAPAPLTAPSAGPRWPLGGPAAPNSRF